MSPHAWLRVRDAGIGAHGQTTFFFISSLPPKVKQLSRYLRNHWTIENSQHDVLDANFAEGASRIRVGNATESSAVVRRMARNVLQQHTPVNDSSRGQRLHAG